MGSESLFTKCKTCGKDISKSAKACPNCGKRQNKLSAIHWLGIIFIILIGVGIFTSPDIANEADNLNAEVSTSQGSDSSLESLMPEGQRFFINTISEYVNIYQEARNELQQSALRDQRKNAVSEILGSLVVASWVGTINQLETNTEGKAILSVRISPNIEIKTWNNALSDIGSNTLIDKGTAVYNDLFDLSNGQQVVFSGSFFPSETDFIEETSLTIDGSMKNPEYLFSFTSVTPIK